MRLADRSSGNAPQRFDIVVDPHQINLKSHEGYMKGSLYLAFVQCTVTGRVLAAKQEKGDLILDEADYRSALSNGLVLAREWVLKSGSEQLRIALCDGSSDNIGSIEENQ